MFELARKRRQTGFKVPNLNLNPMMDMLSILLVFLLVNMASEEQDFVLADNMELPQSTSLLDFTKAVQVKLTKSALMIEDSVIARVANMEFVGVEIVGQRIVPLYEMLKKYQTVTGDPDKVTVVLQADKGFTFKILNQVMRTAAEAGYPNFRLAIEKS